MLEWLTGYGMVEVEHDQVRLTPLGMEGLVHLVDDADIELDARPAIDAMTALDLLSFSAELPEEEADAEFAAWMRAACARPGRQGAAGGRGRGRVGRPDPGPGGQHGRLARRGGRPGLEGRSDEPSLRPYAATHLAQLGVEDAPSPTQADTHWLILDMLTISAGLGRPEFVGSLDDIGDLVNLLDVIWKVPHPHLEELLEADRQGPPGQAGGQGRQAGPVQGPLQPQLARREARAGCAWLGPTACRPRHSQSSCQSGSGR